MTTMFFDFFQGDDKVIDQAFQGRHVERVALRNKSGKTAIMIVDQKVTYE